MIEYCAVDQESNSSECLENEDGAGYESLKRPLAHTVLEAFIQFKLGMFSMDGTKLSENWVLAQRQQLGWPTINSTAFRLHVLIFRENRAVALKVIAARAGTVELDNLLKLKAISPEHPGHSHLPESLDHFQHTGINGTHT
jgi:hypothetical protein